MLQSRCSVSALVSALVALFGRNPVVAGGARAREAASEKVQARTVAALASHYRDNDDSMYAKSFVGCSNVGWDQLRFVMDSKQDPETKALVPLALNDLDAALSKSVNAPCFKSSHTVARSRQKLSKDLGPRVSAS
jgi:hypothetical protein